jgi:serine protease AprX
MAYIYRSVFLCLALALVATSAFAQGVVFGPGLQAELSRLAPAERLTVIVSFHGEGAISSETITALEQIGVDGLYFRSLPIAGVLATAAQVDAISRLSGVLSIWPNEQLEYENDGPTALTGVDRLRADASLRAASGLPFSGQGIGVLINDSGVDGNHPDHPYPSRVVQNVAGQTNLGSWSGLLPYTPTEGVPDTDITGGHGTHIAGTIAGSGRQSGGKYEGVAPGASIIGYGSGAGLFILDTIGGFDYALTNRHRYNIRVVSNSFGATGDVGTDFNPNHPTNVATKRLHDAGIIIVFSAGNSGPGENTITGNFKKAPWVITVAAGDDQARLARFSSRGGDGRGGSVVVDGETFTWTDRPTVTAPGVMVVSTKAATSSLAALSAADDAEVIAPAHLPYYTTMSGTSMACPHVSGIVALMLEANPRLTVFEIKDILERTATNIPGRTLWEVGGGYVNAYAAVVEALGLRDDFGATVNGFRTFNSNVTLEETRQDFTLSFDPTGVTTRSYTFEVGDGLAQIAARTTVYGDAGAGNLLGLRLVAPNGTAYTSGIPVLFALSYIRDVVVDRPIPGTWRVELYGLNGLALPESSAASHVRLKAVGDVDGLDDIGGHEAEGSILAAVTARLADGFNDRRFRPDQTIRRENLAEFLVMGTGIRQFLPTGGHQTFGDVSADMQPYAEAVAVRGAAMKDRHHRYAGVMLAENGSFKPKTAVDRASLAYSLVQSLGLEPVAKGYTDPVRVEYNGEFIRLSDEADIPAHLRGYVQLALDLNILNAYFALEQGRFDLTPTIKAYFRPAEHVTRAAYAVAATRFFDVYMIGDLNLSAYSGGSESTLLSGVSLAAIDDEAHAPLAFELKQNYPNPFQTGTTIAFTLPEASPVRLVVYDVTGREVARLVDGTMDAGEHRVEWDASDLASGVYLYRIEAGAHRQTMRMMVAN